MFCGMTPDGRIMQVLDYPAHPFFVATQYHPELLSPGPCARTSALPGLSCRPRRSTGTREVRHTIWSSVRCRRIRDGRGETPLAQPAAWTPAASGRPRWRQPPSTPFVPPSRHAGAGGRPSGAVSRTRWRRNRAGTGGPPAAVPLDRPGRPAARGHGATSAARPCAGSRTCSARAVDGEVYTSDLYLLAGDLDDDGVQRLVRDFLANPLVHRWRVNGGGRLARRTGGVPAAAGGWHRPAAAGPLDFTGPGRRRPGAPEPGRPPGPEPGGNASHPGVFRRSAAPGVPAGARHRGRRHRRRAGGPGADVVGALHSTRSSGARSITRTSTECARPSGASSSAT